MSCWGLGFASTQLACIKNVPRWLCRRYQNVYETIKMPLLYLALSILKIPEKITLILILLLLLQTPTFIMLFCH